MLASITYLPKTVLDRTDPVFIGLAALHESFLVLDLIFEISLYRSRVGTIVGYEIGIKRRHRSMPTGTPSQNYQNGQKKNPVHVATIHEQDLLVNLAQNGPVWFR